MWRSERAKSKEGSKEKGYGVFTTERYQRKIVTVLTFLKWTCWWGWGGGWGGGKRAKPTVKPT